MSNRIEQVIGDIEEYIDGCKMQAFSSTKIIVDRPQIDEFLEELRQYTPEEVKKYQRMLSNRDKIIADAKKKAAEIEEKAQSYAERMVNENQITQLAYEKASEILKNAQEQAAQIMDSANNDSEMIRDGAAAYTKDLLNNLHAIISGTIEDTENLYTSLLASLNEHRSIVIQNAQEVDGMNEKPAEPSIRTEAPIVSQPSFNNLLEDDDEDDDYYDDED